MGGLYTFWVALVSLSVGFLLNQFNVLESIVRLDNVLADWQRPIIIHSQGDSTYEPPTVHICMTATGSQKYTNYTLTALKSLFLHRSCPVHLHLIVDQTVFESDFPLELAEMNVPLFSFSLYVVSSNDGRMNCLSDFLRAEEIPKLRYVKAFIDEILDPTLDTVIYLDTDIIVMNDIALLWDKFNDFSDDNIFAFAPEFPCVYSEFLHLGVHRYWGYNSGIFLYNLTRARAVRFSETACETVPLVLANQTRWEENHLWYPDQDVFNLMIVAFPEWLLPLPCSWNYQIGPEMIFGRYGCYHAKPNIVHGNAYQFDTDHGEYNYGAVYHALEKTDKSWFSFYPFSRIPIASTHDDFQQVVGFNGWTYGMYTDLVTKTFIPFPTNPPTEVKDNYWWEMYLNEVNGIKGGRDADDWWNMIYGLSVETTPDVDQEAQSPLVSLSKWGAEPTYYPMVPVRRWQSERAGDLIIYGKSGKVFCETEWKGRRCDPALVSIFHYTGLSDRRPTMVWADYVDPCSESGGNRGFPRKFVTQVSVGADSILDFVVGTLPNSAMCLQTAFSAKMIYEN